MARIQFRRIAVVVAFAMTSACALAQQEGQNPKNEFSGSVGHFFISDHHIPGLSFDNVLTTGHGFAFGVGYGRQLWGSDLAAFTLEFPFFFNVDEDVNLKTNVVPGDYSAYFFTPALRINLFPKMYVSPWVSIGGGVGRFVASQNLEFGGSNPGLTSKTSGVGQFGAGIDTPIFKSFSLRGEVRDYYSAPPPLNVDLGVSRQHNLFVGGGLVYHF
jgi:hypothetical protein